MDRAFLRATALLGSVALSALCALPAAAQDTDPTESTVTDVIVTAQRREERAQDVPIVVTAFSAEKLDQLNVTEPQDLYGTVPSLVSGTQGQASRDVQSYSIRGQSTGFLASPGVQLYLSEVPLPSSISLNLQGAPGMFVDLQNVQVLSGPQGTLFGRNTTGGAVLFQPQKPKDEFGGYLQGSVGNLDLRAIEGAINVPVVGDKLIVRLTGAYQDRRGYTRDLVWNKWRDDTHWYTARLGVLFRPTERLENYLVIYGSKSSNNGAGQVHLGFNIPGLIARGSCQEGPTVPGVIASCDVYRRQTQIAGQIGPRATRGETDGFSKIDSWGAINTTDIDLTENLKVRNIVSFQTLKDNYSADSDGTPLQQYGLGQGAALPDFPIPGFTDEFGLPRTPGNVYLNRSLTSKPRDDIEQFTEELQLQGSLLDDHFTFAMGAFYYEAQPAGPWGGSSVQFCSAEATGQITGALACLGTDGRSGVTNKSTAVYGQGTLDLGAYTPVLEGLRVTAGYRYTWDSIYGFSSSWTRRLTDNKCAFGPPAGAVIPFTTDPTVACRFDAALESAAPTWTVGLDYKPIDNMMVYAKASRGYKAGGFNTFAVRPSTTTFLPEELTTYETGFKSDWNFGDVPFRFNATYYYSDYKNIQRPGGDFNLANGAGGAAIFAAEATIQGFEIETNVRPMNGLEFGATVSHAKGDYKKYELPSLGGVSCNNAPFGSTADFSCAPFQFLTPWIYNLYTTIDLPISKDLGDLSLYVNYSHVDDQYTAPGPFEPGATLDGYGLLNASLNWKNVAQSGVDLSLFANNITDELYRVSNTNSWEGVLAWSTLYGEPRTYGLKLKYRFRG